jgi:cell division septation protein DedD
MSDEGLHEIQLNGKQLVFLFMTATVIAVVIFLCGFLTGRGLQAPVRVVASENTVDPTANLQPIAPAAASSTTAGASASSAEELSYAGRLEDPTPINEVLHETSPATPAAAPKAASPVAPPPPSPKPASAKTPSPKPLNAKPSAAKASNPIALEPAVAIEPRGQGFVVQVAAVRQRAEADTIRRRLAGKGYPAFVTSAGLGGPGVFRVRVGKYDSRREAESIASRLEREEQFKPWITR